MLRHCLYPSRHLCSSSCSFQLAHTCFLSQSIFIQPSHMLNYLSTLSFIFTNASFSLLHFDLGFLSVILSTPLTPLFSPKKSRNPYHQLLFSVILYFTDPRFAHIHRGLNCASKNHRYACSLTCFVMALLRVSTTCLPFHTVSHISASTFSSLRILSRFLKFRILSNTLPFN